MASVASRIRSARKQAGLTQVEAAERTGIPLSSYQAYEQGKVSPPFERVDAILAALRGEEGAANGAQISPPADWQEQLRQKDAEIERLRAELELERTKRSPAPSADDKRRAREMGATSFEEAQKRVRSLGSGSVQQDEGPIEKAAELPGVRHEAFGQFLFGFNVTIYQRKDGPIRVDWTSEIPEPEREAEEDTDRDAS